MYVRMYGHSIRICIICSRAEPPRPLNMQWMPAFGREFQFFIFSPKDLGLLALSPDSFFISSPSSSFTDGLSWSAVLPLD